jgi:hypothetical protein
VGLLLSLSLSLPPLLLLLPGTFSNNFLPPVFNGTPRTRADSSDVRVSFMMNRLVFYYNIIVVVIMMPIKEIKDRYAYCVVVVKDTVDVAAAAAAAAASGGCCHHRHLLLLLRRREVLLLRVYYCDLPLFCLN